MRTFLLFFSITLTACQYVPPRDINSPFFSPPVGSQLRLIRTLRISADDAGVFIQDGQAQYSSWKLDNYEPNCDFELRTRSTLERLIEPDTFTVTRTVRDTENFMLTPVDVIGFGFRGGPPHENYMTVLYLHSDKQPDVLRMTCQHWEDPSQGDHLTIKQIRQALGDLFILELAASKP